MFSQLVSMFRRGPDPNRAPQSAAMLGDIVNGVLVRRLPSDFQRVGNMCWTGASTDHIRPIFKFQAMKGMCYSACWGVSIDFVPLLAGQHLRWKKTAKTAKLDLCIDPVDSGGEIPSWCSFFPNDKDRKIELAAEAAAQAASRDWLELNSLAAIAAAYEKRSELNFSRFSLDNYVQTNLAWGLVLLAIGDVGQSDVRLDHFCREFKIAPDAPALEKARSEARALAASR